MKQIRIAAALLIGGNGQTLLVRKRGTQVFMQPGGKIEAGEPALSALVRELAEELNLHIDPATAVYLGAYAAPAVNEPGFEVHCELFEVRAESPVHPAAEIEEVIWVSAERQDYPLLAPLTRDIILPLYRERLATV